MEDGEVGDRVSAEIATNPYFYEQTEAIWTGWWSLTLGNVQVYEFTRRLFELLGEKPVEVRLSIDETHSYADDEDTLVFALGEVSPLVIAHEAAHILELRWGVDPGPTGHGPSTFDAMCWTAAVVEEIVGEM